MLLCSKPGVPGITQGSRMGLKKVTALYRLPAAQNDSSSAANMSAQSAGVSSASSARKQVKYPRSPPRGMSSPVQPQMNAPTPPPFSHTKACRLLK